MAEAVMNTRLYTFGISHYCEKARWALDWHGMPFDEIGWPPGLHVALARRAGVPGTSLPILRRGDTVIQGSRRILDWAEREAGDGSRSLTPTDDAAAAADLENRADDVIGVHVRRFMYAQILTTHGGLVKPYLLMNTSPALRLVGNLTWPAVRRVMIRGMDARPAAAADSRARLEPELERLETRLADGRRYLAGERFSRVDLTVAALLAPLARPEEAPVYRAMTLPPALEREVAALAERPVLRWVRDVYRVHRAAAGG